MRIVSALSNYVCSGRGQISIWEQKGKKNEHMPTGKITAAYQLVKICESLL